MASELLGYNYANFGRTPYGPYWRHIRKTIVLELASHDRVQTLARIRVSEVKSSMKEIYKTWVNKGSCEIVMVDMKQWFRNLIVNIIVKMMFGDHFSVGEEDGDQFQKAVSKLGDLLGAFVPSDAIPGLRWLDLGGYEKKMKKTAKAMDVAVNGWLEDHKRKMDSNCTQTTFMAGLLSRVKEEDHGFSTDVIVKATCLAIYAAGIDTTIVTLTWALALLVNNPQVLKKAQQELENHVGRDRKVEESDINKLVYLQAIIKETTRLYPAAPLSVPHKSMENCVVGGYTIPKGTRLLVNIWKIHHDPQIWTDSFEFRPERFLTNKKEIDVKGRHFELIPFGSGRRICPGMTLALETVQLILANIIHGFEFQNSSNEQIDMMESPGIINHKASPLELLVAPRLLPHVYS